MKHVRKQDSLSWWEYALAYFYLLGLPTILVGSVILARLAFHGS